MTVAGLRHFAPRSGLQVFSTGCCGSLATVPAMLGALPKNFGRFAALPFRAVFLFSRTAPVRLYRLRQISGLGVPY